MPDLHADRHINATNTWTPIALAELVEGLGGAIVATHSQSGSIGHHMTRILKEHGKLNLLKGLITIEGSCSLHGCWTCRRRVGLQEHSLSGLQERLHGHESGVPARRLTPSRRSAARPTTSSWISRAGGRAAIAGPFGPDYVGPFRGISHMMMIEDNPAPGKKGKKGKATNLQVMDVMLEWANKNIKSPEDPILR